MKTRVKKWGNSLALRLPKLFADEVGLEYDSVVELSVDNHQLVIVPQPFPDVSLDTLLDQVTDVNLHHEIDTGPSVGREA